jgi:hypothetical protein
MARLMLAVLLFSSTVGAQTWGGIVGEVRDQSGAVIAGAAIRVTNTGTNAVRSMPSNDAGLYHFPALVPGRYTVRAEAPGFKPAVRSLELQVQQTARVDFALEVGQVTESIEVSAISAQMNTENATVGTVIEQKRIADLPLNGRNFLQLVALSPNVTVGFGTNNQSGRQGGDRMAQRFAIAGARSTSNNYTLDGVHNTDPNFNTYLILPSVEMLQEFKVQTGVYPAEFGRAASQVNVSTRGGGNDYHGALYEFLRNDKMDARAYNFTAADHLRVKNPFQWNQYGFTFGGPVRIPKVINGRDRLFFMSNFERFRERERPVAVYSLPSAAMRTGNFSELSAALFDPAGRSRAADGTIIATQFPGNIIPSNRRSFQAGVLEEFIPLPNRPSEAAPGGAPLRNYQTTLRNTNDKDQFHLRLDWVESAKSSWYGRYSWSDEAIITGGLRLNGRKILSRAKQYMLNNTRTITPAAVNEFRFGVNTFFNAASGELAFVRDVLSELRITGIAGAPAPAWGIPAIGGIPGISGWGGGGDPYETRNASFQALDTFSLLRGKHSFRFGGEVRRDRYNTIGNQFLNPEFLFNGDMTRNPNTQAGGSGIADYYLGYTMANRYAVSPAFLQMRGTSQYYFVDHTWRVRSNLTLNFGVRYEYTAPYTDRSGRFANLDIPKIQFGIINVPDINLHPTMVRAGTSGDFYEGLNFRYPNVRVARDGRLGKALQNPDKNDFAPRIGIAWNPSSKWSIRTGAGMFYSPEVANTKFDLARTLGGRIDIRGANNIPTVTMENFLGPPGTLFSLPSPWTWYLDPGIRNMFMLQYLFNVQREFGQNLVVEAGYLGSISRRLTGLWDINQPVPRGDGSAPVTRAPYPEISQLQSIHGDGRGHYNAASLKLTKRFSGGMTALVGYTWSRSIDTSSAWRGAGDDAAANDATCHLACEKGVSGFNTPHRMVASVLYELPFGRGKKFGADMHALPNAFLGGWQLGSIVALQSGRPFNFRGARNSLLYTDGNRPNATGASLQLPDGQRGLDRWFNTSAVVIPAQGVIGNIGRNAGVGPAHQTWDFSAHKIFPIVEGHSLTFRFEAFNFMNHPVFGTPAASVGSGATPPSNFGQIRGTAASMRQIQLGLKYTF